MKCKKCDDKLELEEACFLDEDSSCEKPLCYDCYEKEASGEPEDYISQGLYIKKLEKEHKIMKSKLESLGYSVGGDGEYFVDRGTESHKADKDLSQRSNCDVCGCTILTETTNICMDCKGNN